MAIQFAICPVGKDLLIGFIHEGIKHTFMMPKSDFKDVFSEVTKLIQEMMEE